MKKFSKIILILILLAIIAFCVCKFIFAKNKNNSKEDFSELKNYLSDIYGTTFLIPEFNDINKASEEWLWENVNQYLWNHNDEYHEKNNQEYGYTYEDISKIVKILYGDNLNKKFPTGSVSMRYDPHSDCYGPASFGITNYYSYQIDNIKKSGNTYTISLYDYTISTYYSQSNLYAIYNNYEYLINLDEGTPIITVASLKDKEFENLLKQKDKLSHKILTVEYDSQSNLYHIKSCKYEDTKPEEILKSVYYEAQASLETDSTEYLIRTEFKDVQEQEGKITATIVKTLKESWDSDNTYETQNQFSVVKKDGKWCIE